MSAGALQPVGADEGAGSDEIRDATRVGRTMTRPSPARLTDLEIACGWPLDVRRSAPSLPASGLDPFAALQQAVVPALRRPPCVVSFSGGVDSSLVLAAASEAARREGLAAPVPVTLRFPAAGETHEGEWQEKVIRHLRIQEWVQLSFDDELDLIGPVAADCLRRHGVLWPPNAHFHVPIIEQARGGAVLTGYGGDHLFSAWPSRHVASVLSGRTAPVPRDVLRLVATLAPARVRCLRERSRVPEWEWLTRPARRHVRRLEARVAADAPRSWSRFLRWQMGTRRVLLAQASLDLLAADAVVLHPLLNPLFAGALARRGKWLGHGDRARLVSEIASHALPADLAARPTKARFKEVFWNHHSRRFAANWDGRGVDPDLVDIDRVREQWGSPAPHFGTATLLQQAWLAGGVCSPSIPSGGAK